MRMPSQIAATEAFLRERLPAPDPNVAFIGEVYRNDGRATVADGGGARRSLQQLDAPSSSGCFGATSA
jgi:hypothetical protein